MLLNIRNLPTIYNVNPEHNKFNVFLMFRWYSIKWGYPLLENLKAAILHAEYCIHLCVQHITFVMHSIIFTKHLSAN